MMPQRFKIADGKVSDPAPRDSSEWRELGTASLLTKGTGGPLGEMMTGMPAVSLSVAGPDVFRDLSNGHSE